MTRYQTGQWWPSGRNRPIYYAIHTEQHPRPWISIYDVAVYRTAGWLAICWMCHYPDPEGRTVYLFRKAAREDQIRRFVAQHRNCGFALEPRPDPRSPDFEVSGWSSLYELCEE